METYLLIYWLLIDEHHEQFGTWEQQQIEIDLLFINW